MKLHLDSTLCQAYGLCQEQAPEQIELDEWGYARVVTVEVRPGAEWAARAAVEACPNRALRLAK